MDKKYQIFVSSTYEDLKNERNEVAKAILEIGDIPVGMEMFSAADESQWKLIQRQIEQSDYYVVIIAHRYGSMVQDISYTELEYDFAVQKGVPVLGFVIDDSVPVPPRSVEKDEVIQRRLAAFKAKVKTRIVSFWTSPESLAGKVLAALGKQKVLAPRPGWVRALNLPGPETLSELARLAQEVGRLSEENTALREKASVEATFYLVDAMADDVECQALIFMYETGIDLPRHVRYVFRYRSGSGGSGMLGGFSGKDRLLNAGMFRSGGGGQYLTLTDMGRRLAEWLIAKGRKCDVFWTPVGGWGTVEPGSHEAKWIEDAKKENSGYTETAIRPAQPPSPESKKDAPN